MIKQQQSYNTNDINNNIPLMHQISSYSNDINSNVPVVISETVQLVGNCAVCGDRATGKFKFFFSFNHIRELKLKFLCMELTHH